MKLDELSRILRENDPAAVLVDPPVLRQVLRGVTGATWAFQVPHAHCLVVDRFTLFKHVERDQLHLPADHALPDAVLLLERPTTEELSGPRLDLLGRYWQLLFHAAAHRELNARLANLSPVGLRERVEQIGPAAFEEARNVLAQDGFLPEGADDRAAYTEFAAVFLELRYFNPTLISVCFPSLPGVDVVAKVLERDIDGWALFNRTHLPDAPDPTPRTDDQSDESHDFYYRLERSALRLARIGDTVGAAIQYTRAARVAPANLTSPAQESARQEIHRLVGRLQRALHMSDAEAENWKQVLPTLLDKADQGTRPVEAAILHDLQRACLDHEQMIFTLDLIVWLSSAGHKPIRRELKSQRFVRVPAQLRLAARRLAAARLSDADRQSLSGLLKDALDRAESQLRGQFRPLLRDALLDAGLQPGLLPETAALNKTVEELLDRISSAGFLGFADVRDAIARGQMKLSDLSGADEYVRGDPLLRLDRRLATELDGVYRRAEPYTRWLERLTSFNFGTETGRWLTWNVTFPFGVAFLAGEFAWLTVYEQQSRVPDPVGKLKSAVDTAAHKLPSHDPAPPPNVEHPPEPSAHSPVVPHGGTPKASFLDGWNTEPAFHAGWMLLGVILLLVIRSAVLRGGLAAVGRTAYRVARFLFWDVPTRMWANHWIRSMAGSVPAQFGLNYIAKPLGLAGIVWWLYEPLWYDGWVPRVVTFVACVFSVNFPLGQAVEAVLWEMIQAMIGLIRSFPAVLHWVSDLFRDMVDVLEWALAWIEDWLRLRGKSGPLVVAIRATAGLIWLPFAFFIRFYIVVLFEPMLNPLKLPLSILFAKFVYPLLIVIGLLKIDTNSVVGFSSDLVEPLSHYIYPPLAWLLVIGTLYLMPDAVTFLFWEMRENWRLYRANRPSSLKPVAVGPHGETIKGLLHWGFHSGTVPRLYARLRAAEREAARTDVWRDARTYRAALRGVEEAICRFVARDFIQLLNDPLSGWGGPQLSVGNVTLGTNRIRLHLVPGDGGLAACLEWEDRSGWLVAKWAEPGFLATLPDHQARPLEDALAYLYKRAGVDVAREQARAELPKETTDFDIGPEGLLVWYGGRESAPRVYDLRDPGNDLRPQTLARRPAAGPTLDARQVVFGRVPLTWSQWVSVWRVVGDGRPPLGPPEYRLTLLPPPRRGELLSLPATMNGAEVSD